MTERYIPLSIRTSEQPDAIQSWNVLHPGVPNHLRPTVNEWIDSICRDHTEVIGICERRLRYPHLSNDRDPEVALWRHLRGKPANTLDVLDLMLHYLEGLYEENKSSSHKYIGEDAARRAVALSKALSEANSAWSVVVQPHWGLAQVVDETARRAFESTRDDGADSGLLIAQAWHATFRQTPDYTIAYSKVVQAVEAASIPVLAPKDRDATLGKVINNLQTALHLWTVSGLDDKTQPSAATLLAMLQTVWQNHQRHASNDGSAPEPAERDETEAVLFLAITIVQWFQRGFVQRIEGR